MKPIYVCINDHVFARLPNKLDGTGHIEECPDCEETIKIVSLYCPDCYKPNEIKGHMDCQYPT